MFCLREQYISTLRMGAVQVSSAPQPDLPLASACSEMIRWSRVLLSHTLDAARSY